MPYFVRWTAEKRDGTRLIDESIVVSTFSWAFRIFLDTMFALDTLPWFRITLYKTTPRGKQAYVTLEKDLPVCGSCRFYQKLSRVNFGRCTLPTAGDRRIVSPNRSCVAPWELDKMEV